MLFWIYWAVALCVTILVAWELLERSGWRERLTAALVLVPFLLRALLIK